MSGGDPFTAEQRRAFDEQAETLEALPLFASEWPAKNTKALEAARLPLNPLVLKLPPPTIRCLVRLTAAVESFGCDILGTSTLKNELPANLSELGRVHLLEITKDGFFKLHKLTATYPSAADLRNEE